MTSVPPQTLKKLFLKVLFSGSVSNFSSATPLSVSRCLVCDPGLALLSSVQWCRSISRGHIDIKREILTVMRDNLEQCEKKPVNSTI